MAVSIAALATNCCTLFFVTYAFCWLAVKGSSLLPKRLLAENFNGDNTPVIGGIIAVPLLILALVGLHPFHFLSTYRFYEIITLLGFGLLGVNDDLFGDGSSRGFRGHFKALICDRRVTTGLFKAVGGGILALCIAIALPFHVPKPPLLRDGLILVYAAVIALTANTSNLLDLRPGRCGAFLIAATTITLAWFVLARFPDGISSCLLLLSATIPVFMFDRNAKLMLGDAGSNALGASLGYVCIGIGTDWFAVVFLALNLIFQIWCEKRSLSKAIENTPWLRAIDRKIGVR